jgi:pimeloyl-ACP methyl ester carboxylesterase
LESLRPYLPQIEYHKWERCGHYPWLEKHVHEEFFSLLSSWLTTHL